MTDPRLQMALNLDKYRIGLDDTFAFKCRGCGKCCKQREDIILTTRDLFNIAVKLSLTMEQTIEKYCEVYIGRSSRIPIVRLKPKGVNRVCPLLQNDKCIVHDTRDSDKEGFNTGGSKPVVCALFPLGRVYMYSDGKTGEMFDEPQLHYVLNDTSCGSRRKKQTVRAWLEQFGIPVEDEFFVMWNDVVHNLSACFRVMVEEKGTGKGALEMLWNAEFAMLYTNYDTKAEFMPQFVENTGKLLGVCDKGICDKGVGIQIC